MDRETPVADWLSVGKVGNQDFKHLMDAFAMLKDGPTGSLLAGPHWVQKAVNLCKSAHDRSPWMLLIGHSYITVYGDLNKYPSE